jgi:protein SCO1/2
MRSRAPLGVVAVLLLVAACATSGGSDGSGGPAAVSVDGAAAGWQGTPVRDGYPLPQQEFTDTSGSTVVPAADAADGVTLVFFGYTHCPDICNVVLANIASALRGADATVRERTRVLFVSTDPARDEPGVVRDYLDRFDPTYEGLVAPVATVEQAASDLYVGYERPDGSAGGYRGYEVEHGTHTTAFVDGDATVVWSEDTSVADLRADLTRLARLA